MVISSHSIPLSHHKIYTSFTNEMGAHGYTLRVKGIET